MVDVVVVVVTRVAKTWSDVQQHSTAVDGSFKKGVQKSIWKKEGKEEEGGGRRARAKRESVSRGPTDLHLGLARSGQRQPTVHRRWKGLYYYTTLHYTILYIYYIVPPSPQCLCCVYLGSACPPTCSHTLFRYRARTVGCFLLSLSLSLYRISPTVTSTFQRFSIVPLLYTPALPAAGKSVFFPFLQLDASRAFLFSQTSERKNQKKKEINN